MHFLKNFMPRNFAREIDLGGDPWPAHYFMSALPLTTGVYLICAVHALVAVAAIGTCSSVAEISLSGVRVPPWLQIATAAWYAIGLGFIACGVLGVRYSLEPHLRRYFQYLSVNFILQFLPFFVFLATGSICTTVMIKSGRRDPHSRADLGSTFACG